MTNSISLYSDDSVKLGCCHYLLVNLPLFKKIAIDLIVPFPVLFVSTSKIWTQAQIWFAVVVESHYN